MSRARFGISRGRYSRTLQQPARVKMKLNLKAADLRRKLFELTNEFKALSLAVHNTEDIEASLEIDQAACDLARIYESLPDVFIDGYRDAKDQSHRVEIS